MQDYPLLACHEHTTLSPDQRDYHAHTHDSHELYCFLAGDARYAVEGTLYPLHPGDLLVMRRSESHHLVVLSGAPYHRITIDFDPPPDAPPGLLRAFDDRPLGRNNHYPAALFPDERWAEHLSRLCRATDHAVRSAYLTVLLGELSECLPRIQREAPPAEIDPAADLLCYINSHITDKMSLGQLCAHFYLSRSQLSRRFRRATGSSVWEYITAKRLLLARELLERGEKPTVLYARCGFGDYVTFYRAYRRRFGVSPSDRHQLSTEEKR